MDVVTTECVLTTAKGIFEVLHSDLEWVTLNRSFLKPFINGLNWLEEAWLALVGCTDELTWVILLEIFESKLVILKYPKVQNIYHPLVLFHV
jgi:hypothetical protein